MPVVIPEYAALYLGGAGSALTGAAGVRQSPALEVGIAMCFFALALRLAMIPVLSILCELGHLAHVLIRAVESALNLAFRDLLASRCPCCFV